MQVIFLKIIVFWENYTFLKKIIYFWTKIWAKV